MPVTDADCKRVLVKQIDETVSIRDVQIIYPDGVDRRKKVYLEQGEIIRYLLTARAVPPVHYQYPLRVQQINYAKVLSVLQ